MYSPCRLHTYTEWSLARITRGAVKLPADLRTATPAAAAAQITAAAATRIITAATATTPPAQRLQL